MKTKLLLMLLVAAALSVSVVAGPLKVVNAGFEDDVLDDGAYLYAYESPIKGWSDGYYDHTGGGGPSGGAVWWSFSSESGVLNPDETAYAGGTAPEGQNVAFVYNYAGYDMGMGQILEHKFLQGVWYTLTAKIGSPLDNPDAGGGVYTGDYIIQVMDRNNSVIKEWTGSPPIPGAWIDFTPAHFRVQGGQSAFGRSMEIRILMEDFDGLDDYDHELHFDAITLSHDQPSMFIDTPPMVTWDGEPVDLNATAHDGTLGQNPPTIVSQTWTADPAVGVVFSDTGPSDKDPTVTVTHPGDTPLFSAFIANASFEDRGLSDGGYGYWPYDQNVWGWARRGNYATGDYNPNNDEFPAPVPDGENVGWVWCTGAAGTNGAQGMTQVLDYDLKANVVYTLTARIGNTTKNTAWAGYRVELLAGGEWLNSDENTLPVDDPNWITSTVVYDSGATPDQLGEPLEIRLEAAGVQWYVGGQDWVEVHFDDIQLSADSAIFPRPAKHQVILTLVGTDSDTVDTQPVSLKFEVYPDPCKAALGGGKKEATDFDSDCVAGLPDLAVVLESWMEDLNLTGPIDKP